MALQTAIGGLWMPSQFYWSVAGTNPGFASMLIDVSGDVAGMVFRIGATGTVSKLGFRTGSVNTSQPLNVGLYGVDKSGNPNINAPYGGMVAGSISSVAANSVYTVTLSTPASVTKGDIVSVIVSFVSTVGNLNISYLAFGGGNPGNSFPYSAVFHSGSWTLEGLPITWLEYNDGSYALTEGVFPISTITSNNVTSASNPSRYAVKFSLPFPTRHAGWLFNQAPNATTSNTDLIIYDANNTVLSQTTSYGNEAIAFNQRSWVVDAITSTTLTANTVYRASLNPNSLGINAIYDFTTPNIASMAQMGGGDSWQLSTWDGTSWTDRPNRMPIIALRFDQFSDGVGTGGTGTTPTAVGTAGVG